MSEPKIELIKPFYRPSVEAEKRRYWDLKNQERRIAARRAKHPIDPNRKPIPDNSVPWLDHPARNLTELVNVMRDMEASARQWGTELTVS